MDVLLLIIYKFVTAFIRETFVYSPNSANNNGSNTVREHNNATNKLEIHSFNFVLSENNSFELF